MISVQPILWAELISCGLYTNTSEPPCDNSMFQRAGGSQCTKKKADNDITQAVVKAATAITSALVDSKKSSGISTSYVLSS